MNKEKSKMRNSKYTKEFRDSTIQLVLSGGKSVLQISRDLDVNSKTIYNWVREYKRKNNIPINAPGTSQNNKSTVKESTEDELRRLRRENKILKQEY